MKKIFGINTANITRLQHIFGPDEIEELNCENVKNFNNSGCGVRNINKISNIKVNCNWFLCGDIRLHISHLVNHDTLVRALEALYDYSDSEEVHTFGLGAINLAKLTEDEIAIGTEKGWTIS